MFVHNNNMRTLPNDIRPVFDEERCVFNKMAGTFSFTPLDQANDHNVKVMKGSGGIVGIWPDTNLICNWAIVSREVVQIINEFE